MTKREWLDRIDEVTLALSQVYDEAFAAVQRFDLAGGEHPLAALLASTEKTLGIWQQRPSEDKLDDLTWFQERARMERLLAEAVDRVARIRVALATLIANEERARTPG